MQWIKANIRPPEHFKLVPVKIDGSYSIASRRYNTEDEDYFVDPTGDIWPYDQIEWLDESIQPSSTLSEMFDANADVTINDDLSDYKTMSKEVFERLPLQPVGKVWEVERPTGKDNYIGKIFSGLAPCHRPNKSYRDIAYHMSKDLKDYLQYYIGCKVIGTFQDQSGSIGILTGVTNGGYECEIQFLLEDGINVSEEPEYNCIEEVKPVLRPLESMDKAEVKTFIDISDFNMPVTSILSIGSEGIYFKYQSFEMERKLAMPYNELNPKQFMWLLSKSFDIFSLIPEGLAISSTTN